jgi:small-conductance mechanosensitive channel
MKELRRLLVVIPAAVLVACLVGIFLTRGSMANLPFLRARGRRTVSSDLVDQRPWQTAKAVAALAVSAEEKEHARQALRLADHEVDQAFAQALRQASLDVKKLTPEAQGLQQQVATLQQMVKEDQAKVDPLAAAAKSNPSVNTDDLDVAKAQLQLDKDELADAEDDFARASGDKRGEIQQELATREAEMKKFDEQNADLTQTAVASSKRYGTLAGRVGAWFDQRSRLDALREAQAQADADAKSLSAQHDAIQKQMSVADSAAATASDSDGSKSKVARLGQMHSMAQIHGILDDRVQTQQQLSQIYGRWINQVTLQHGIVLHLILQSVAWIAFLALFSVLAAMAVNKMLDRLKIDRRRLHTLRTVIVLGIQLFTLLLIVLVIFGPPSQMPVILGFATAGITVVFQDFIIAFFGWFVLMGKNGISVGDWVEINGVVGEVVEVGLFRTSLLETGNWTDKGHPTGRRVTMMNSFAITGQYFNLSTSGQWLWDEITVHVPSGPEGYKVIAAIRQALVEETAKDAKEAEAEWQTVTRQHGLSQFSSEPSIDLRPAASGVDVVVRYVTRAGNRFDLRNKIYQAVIALLHQQDEEAAAAKEAEQKALG